MSRIGVALVVGGALGILDGLTAWFTPEVRSQLLGIVIGSTVKGLIAGALIGLFARKAGRVLPTVIFGTVIGAPRARDRAAPGVPLPGDHPARHAGRAPHRIRDDALRPAADGRSGDGPVGSTRAASGS